MDDEQIIQRGGDQSDVEEYAKSNGADLTEEDFMYEAIRQRIGEIIGEASMCWSETPKGVFNSDKAKELVDEVMCHIEYPLNHPEDKNTDFIEEKRFRIKEDELYKIDEVLQILNHK